ncbi:MAG: hypothetical protein ABR529_00145 [Actinomycetota bacterium]
MQHATEVRITSEPNHDWIVWLAGRIVGRFTLVGDALAYAAMLECNPRERAGAVAL